jgi:hypothetical protein
MRWRWAAGCTWIGGVLLLACFTAGCGSGSRAPTASSGGRAVAGGRHSSTRAPDPNSGTFAGYNLLGRHVRAIAATWTVPAVQPRSGAGKAGTWVGVQGHGIKNYPFLQVGTNEEHLALHPAQNIYYAFWSDTRRHFRPALLFAVRAGDRVLAELQLRRGRWHVLLKDLSLRTAARFSTLDEGRAVFEEAEWVQEDILNGKVKRAYPYPALAAVTFSRLTVDGSRPPAGHMLSTWMVENGRNLGPGPVHNDEFTLLVKRPSPAGRRYLAVVDPEDAAGKLFDTQLIHWSARTSAAKVAAASTAMARTLHHATAALAHGPWPRTDRLLIARLIRSTDAMRSVLRRPPTGPEAIAHFKRAIALQDVAVARDSQRLRRRLGLPALTPSN